MLDRCDISTNFSKVKTTISPAIELVYDMKTSIWYPPFGNVNYISTISVYVDRMTIHFLSIAGQIIVCFQTPYIGGAQMDNQYVAGYIQ